MADLVESGIYFFLFKAWRLHALKRKLNPNFFLFLDHLVPVVPVSCLGLPCLKSYRQGFLWIESQIGLVPNVQPYESHSENAQYQIFRGV